MSNHFSADNLKFPGDDRRLDLTDIFTFTSADDPDKTASRLPGLIKDMHLVVVEGAPHAIAWTHAGQVNTALLDFLRT